MKSPIPTLGLSNGARAARPDFVADWPAKWHDNVTVNGLLPGQYNTDRIENIIANTAKTENLSLAAARDMLEKKNRLGVWVKYMNSDLPVHGSAVHIRVI